MNTERLRTLADRLRSGRQPGDDQEIGEYVHSAVAHSMAEVIGELIASVDDEIPVREGGMTEHSNYACGCAECRALRERYGSGGRVQDSATDKWMWMEIGGRVHDV